MRKRRGFVPGSMARLEERVVLSPGLAAEIGPSVAVMPRVRLDLRGTISGVESRELRAPIVYRLRLSGRGEVAPLGQVQASGTLTIGTRTIWRPGEPTIYDGQLTLVARKGDVFVHIHGIVGGPSRPHSVHLRCKKSRFQVEALEGRIALSSGRPRCLCWPRPRSAGGAMRQGPGRN